MLIVKDLMECEKWDRNTLIKAILETINTDHALNESSDNSALSGEQLQRYTDKQLLEMYLSIKKKDKHFLNPACDLVIAWSLLNANSRKIFKENLDHIDENTWERGRGWALSIAVIMLPYYKNSNPVLAKLARRIIVQILSET